MASAYLSIGGHALSELLLAMRMSAINSEQMNVARKAAANAASKSDPASAKKAAKVRHSHFSTVLVLVTSLSVYIFSFQIQLEEKQHHYTNALTKNAFVAL